MKTIINYYTLQLIFQYNYIHVTILYHFWCCNLILNCCFIPLIIHPTRIINFFVYSSCKLSTIQRWSSTLSLWCSLHCSETFPNEILQSRQNEFLIMLFLIWAFTCNQHTFSLLFFVDVYLILRCKGTSIQLSLLQQDTVNSVLWDASGFSSLLT